MSALEKGNAVQGAIQNNAQTTVDGAARMTGLYTPSPAVNSFNGSMQLDLNVLDRVITKDKTDVLLNMDTTFKEAAEVWLRIAENGDPETKQRFVDTFGPPLGTPGAPYSGIRALQSAIAQVTQAEGLKAILIDSEKITKAQTNKRYGPIKKIEFS